jgi:protein-L-isoaspartate(D-aspartate) O-methyltransferase
VLEIGTGSGYAAAVLAHAAAQVYSVERIAALADAARERLQALGLDRVRILCGDGSLGWPEHGPFDAISVAAAGPKVPSALKSQLKIGGRLVMPVGGSREHQDLLRVTRLAEHDFHSETITAVCFVPLLGAQGWPQ